MDKKYKSAKDFIKSDYSDVLDNNVRDDLLEYQTMFHVKNLKKSDIFTVCRKKGNPTPFIKSEDLMKKNDSKIKMEEAKYLHIESDGIVFLDNGQIEVSLSRILLDKNKKLCSVSPIAVLTYDAKGNHISISNQNYNSSFNTFKERYEENPEVSRISEIGDKPSRKKAPQIEDDDDDHDFEAQKKSKKASAKPNKKVERQSVKQPRVISKNPQIAQNELIPEEIKKLLDRDIIGQENVKKSLSMLSFYYFQSMRGKRVNADVQLQKTNAMLLGDTGSGKTLIVKTLADILDVPFVTADASSLTPAGYKGDNLSTIFEPLAHCKKDNELGPHGIVFIDEFDKMITRRDRYGLGQSIQNEFLKIIEGSDITLFEDSFRHPMKGEKIKTSNLMFIFAGSFPDLKHIITERLGGSGKIKVPSGSDDYKNLMDEDEILSKVKHEDLIKFGVSREFLGRVPVVKSMESLNKEMMVDIFTKPRNSIYNQYKERLSMINVGLEFTSGAVDYISEQALKNKTGARGLANIMSSIMDNVLFELPDEKNVKLVKVDRKAAINKSPIIVRGKEKGNPQELSM